MGLIPSPLRAWQSFPKFKILKVKFTSIPNKKLAAVGWNILSYIKPDAVDLAENYKYEEVPSKNFDCHEQKCQC